MKKINEIIKKAEGTLIIITLILSVVLAMAVPADDYQPQNPDPIAYITAESSNVTIGTQINLTLNLSTVDNIDTWWLVNMTYNWDKVGIVDLVPDPDTGYNATIGSFWTNPGTGSYNNVNGYITDPQGFTMGGTSSDVYLCAMNFSSEAVGVAYFNLSDFEVHFEGPEVSSSTSNCTVTIHSQGPQAGLTATMYNYTIINITGIANGTGDDTVVLCGKAGSYPTDYTDGVQYNGTDAFFNDTGLSECTAYYYRAWGYNATSNLYSLDYQSAYATTECTTNFTFAGPVPANTSTTTNCTYSIAVNVTVINSQGRSFDYWVNGSNGQSTSGSNQAANTSIGRTLTGLSHNTMYWWNVTAVEHGLGNSWQENYNFTTGNGGGSTPTVSTPTPANGATGVSITLATMSALVNDADGDIINATFYWLNGTQIGNNLTNTAGTLATITPGISLAYNTTYRWYVGVSDSCLNGESSTYSFTTEAAAIDVTKEWAVAANNTIVVWVNTTNVGAVNLTDLVLNETLDTNVVVVGVNESFDVGTTNWTVPFLNTTGASKYYNITMFLNLSGTVANNTEITNTVYGIFRNNTLDTATFDTGPKLCFYATKEANMTTLDWNTTHVNFTINVTNCGNFYLNWVQINESYGANLTFNSSTITGNSTNEQFNITQIVPGATGSMTIRLNTSYNWGVELVNGTSTCNNITVRCNETSSEVTFSECLFTGARTSIIRVYYTSIYYDIAGLTNQIFNILGVILIIGILLIMVYYIILRRQNY